MAPNPVPVKARFCSSCGTRLMPDGVFCHECGAAADGSGAVAPSVARPSATSRWALPVFALAVLAILTAIGIDSRGGSSASTEAPDAVPLSARAMQAPDISSMSPEEQADRLFNRVMRLWTEGKTDSAAFFATMAMGAIEALTPLDAHRRYDMGLVALVMGNTSRAMAQADTILARHRNHLLGLSLAARASDARGDAAAAAQFRRRMLASERAERALGLKEYTDHDADIRAALELARRR